MTLDDGHRTAPARVELLPDDPAFPGQKNLMISVHEGTTAWCGGCLRPWARR